MIREWKKKLEENLESVSDPNEKLRKVILTYTAEDILTTIDPMEITNDKVEAFLEKIEIFCNMLKDCAEDGKVLHRAQIKILEINECILEQLNYVNVEEKIKVGWLQRTRNSFESLYEWRDWRAMRKILDVGAKFIELEKLNKLLEPKEMIKNFLQKTNMTRKSLLWRKKCASVEEILRILKILIDLEGQEVLINSLRQGRFDKRNIKGLENSLIIGDEGGLFYLLNSVKQKSELESIALEKLSPEFLNEKRKNNDKVILGEGSSGKVRLALSVFNSSRTICGQLVCVKKIRKSLSETTNLAFEDYFAGKFSEVILSPSSIDMALLTNDELESRHKIKGYVFMEIFPENTAKKVFGDPAYQKWEYQKPYIIDTISAMKELLTVSRFYNSDLKPENTLFDPISRKTALIDLGSSVVIDNTHNLEDCDCAGIEFSYTKTFCPPEIMSEDKHINQHINFYKAISYLCGKTIETIASKTDLETKDREELERVKNKLIIKNPDSRMNIEDAIAAIKSIGPNDSIQRAVFEHYVFKVRSMINIDPSALNLDVDIIKKKNLGIIEQTLVEKNPKLDQWQKAEDLFKELAQFLTKSLPDGGLFLLLGEAGSGKSLALQLMFLKEITDWKYGSPLPIFFNMANDVDLEKVFERINATLGCNLKLQAPNERIHLFIDSYDEAAGSVSHQLDEANHEPSVIQRFESKLKSWSSWKIVLTCRADFVGWEEHDGFKLINDKALVTVRYIAPFCYGVGDFSKLKGETLYLIERWLKGENMIRQKNEIEEYFSCLEKMGLVEKIKTGLFLNMIMRIITNGKNPLSRHLRGFEIYEKTIREEFYQNFEKVVQIEKEKETDRKALISEAIRTFFHDDEWLERLQQDNTKERIIFEGLERICEKIAAAMTDTDRNRLTFAELEALVTPDKRPYSTEEEYLSRVEQKTLYHICKIMGLKLEKRTGESANRGTDLAIGFSHETYKNYFLLRELKGLLKKNEGQLKHNAVLDNKSTIKNKQLLRFFGEEIQKDCSFKNSLRKVLEQEQNKV